MESLEEVTDQLFGVATGFGIDLTSFETSSADKKIVCFNREGGERICEEIPTADEVKCNEADLCSIYLTNIEKTNPVDKWAKKYNIRAFPVNRDGITTKTITGIIPKKNLVQLSSAMGRDFNIVDVKKLRKVKYGDIDPPVICKMNPLSSKCAYYVESKDWQYLGPFKGWVKADNLRNAIKLSKSNGKSNSQSKIDVNETKNIKTDVMKVLTTV